LTVAPHPTPVDRPATPVPVPAPIPLHDSVSHPAHYTSGGIECIDAIEAQLSPEEFLGFLRGTVAKYVWRCRLKGGAEDTRKAQWYLSLLAQRLQK
jgi:hypothetical protein